MPVVGLGLGAISKAGYHSYFVHPHYAPWHSMPCRLPSNSPLSPRERADSCNVFFFFLNFLFDQCFEILGEYVFCDNMCKIRRKEVMLWKSCSHNQCDQRSLSVWSSVMFYLLGVVSLETDTAIDMVFELPDVAKQMFYCTALKTQLSLVFYVYISKIIMGPDFSPLWFRKSCHVSYLI